MNYRLSEADSLAMDDRLLLTHDRIYLRMEHLVVKIGISRVTELDLEKSS